MPDDKQLDRYADLVDQMAKAQGIDLDEAEQRGNISPEEREQSVLTCLGCAQTEACERWLSENKDGAEAAPGYCRNEVLFKALRE
jgi:hypothetical protein